MTSSDEDLARAAATGDRDAFAALLSRCYDGLFRVCFRLTGQRAAAEDLTQDICLALPAKLAGFRGQAKFTTWLYRVAVNAWGDWERNRQAEIAETAAAMDWLQTAMNSLPQDLRDTAALTMGDEMTHKQAAEVLGVSEGTISWRLSEIRTRLRALREEETVK